MPHYKEDSWNAFYLRDNVAARLQLHRSKITKKSVMLRILFLLCLSLGAAQFPNAQPTAEQQRQVDAMFADWNRHGSPGGSLAIVSKGEMVMKQGYGWADLEHQIPNMPHTVFYAGSVSKQFVAMCVLLLEEQGRISLDDEMRKYLPDLTDYGTPITIRHAVHHLSGLRDYLTLWQIGGRDYLDRLNKQAVLEMIFRQRALNFAPGTAYSYSNSGYILLAEIVERVSGQSLRQFARQHIFEPLGMSSSFFNDNTYGLIPNRAFGYRRGAGGGFENLLMRFDLVGSGGLYTTVEDLAKWDRNFYENRLGKKSPQLIEKLLTEGRFSNGQPCGYAGALVPGQYRGLRTFSHTGSLGGYRAAFVRFPEQQLSIILLGNAAEFAPEQKAYAIADVLLAGQLQDRKSPDQTAETNPQAKPLPVLSAQELPSAAGRYYSEELDAFFTISLKNNELHLRPGNLSAIPLRDLASDPSFSLEWERGGKKKEITGMVLSIGGMKNFRMLKQN